LYTWIEIELLPNFVGQINVFIYDSLLRTSAGDGDLFEFAPQEFTALPFVNNIACPVDMLNFFYHFCINLATFSFPSTYFCNLGRCHITDNSHLRGSTVNIYPSSAGQCVSVIFSVMYLFCN